MGRLAVELLAAAIDDPAHAAPPATVRLPMVLRERESTGRAPDRGAVARAQRSGQHPTTAAGARVMRRVA